MIRRETVAKVILRPCRGSGFSLTIAVFVFKSKPDIVRARLYGTSCTVTAPGQGYRVWRGAVIERNVSGRIVDDGQAFRDIARRATGKGLE